MPASYRQFIEKTWDDEIVPTLVDYIKIPNKSPAFDADWQEHGYMDQAVELIQGWCEQRAAKGMQMEVVRLEGRTPLLFMEIPGDSDHTVLLYGHLDKQPEMTGWDEDLGPWKPVLRDDKLYGRGGADDGYAAFASLTAINALQQAGVPHARCVVLIEACEESGSDDLPHYVDALKDRIGSPELVICLDSGCGNYDQLWMTTSLRGMIGGVLSVEVISEGVHSGDATGVVPSTFRILRHLLDRVEDPATGEILVKECQVDIPARRVEQAELAAQVLGDQVVDHFPFHPGVKPVAGDLPTLVLNRTWRPALAVTGASGLPALSDAGNVLRPITEVKLSMRIPPVCDPVKAGAAVKQLLETDPPYDAKVSFTVSEFAAGWNAPQMSDWLTDAAEQASQNYFNKPFVCMGEGGTIPFMGMLGEKFPQAEFLITGVLGPQSNAHGPNEFLHIPMGKKVTCCVADILAAHYKTL